MTQGYIRIDKNLIDNIILADIYQNENVERVYGFDGKKPSLNYGKFFRALVVDKDVYVICSVEFEDNSFMLGTMRAIYGNLKDKLEDSLRLNLKEIKFL